MIPAVAQASGAGAPIKDIALVAGIISAATVAMLAVVVAYRRGGAKPLRFAGDMLEYAVGVPGWAAIPGLGAIATAVITFMGAVWDIGIHIGKGRDAGPFGTVAHYPFLVGLVGLYLCGVLAVGMAPVSRRRASRSAIEIRGLGPVPVGALLILAGGGYAMLGFPLDDLWHRVFGQDVTLWGPTHTMFFGGVVTAACGAVFLMVEGARAKGREPFGGWSPWRRPLPGLLGGIFLFVATHALDEFNWGVPQYRQVWQPLLLAAIGAFALVAARSLGGRGATAGALMAYLPLQLIEVLMIGAFHTTRPDSILFVAEAVIVEALMWRGRGLRRGALAGLGVGTLGFAAEYGWSQIGQPLPWRPALIAEGLPTAALAGVAGGVLATLLAGALRGEAGRVRHPLTLALAAAATVVGLAVNAGISTEPTGATMTIALSHQRTAVTEGGKRTRVADVSVRMSRPDLARDANWTYILAWQGGGRVVDPLVRHADGTLTSTRPVPVGGHWKSFVRIHKGRTLASAAIRMPADPALHFAGFPALDRATRPMMRDTRLLQIERKDDGPLWAWTPALLLVMTLNLALLALVGATCVRVGRPAAGAPVPRQARTARHLTPAGT
jgi:hypothetical protein